MSVSKVKVFIACSLDGFIAGEGDNLDFLNLAQIGEEDYGYKKFCSESAFVVMGRKTFDWVFNQIQAEPHPNIPTFVITSEKRSNIGNTTFYNGDLSQLIIQLKEQNKGHIYCDGGAHLIKNLLSLQLIDEFIITMIPVMIGSGTRLFVDNTINQQWELVGSKSYPNHVLQVHYKIQKSTN